MAEDTVTHEGKLFENIDYTAKTLRNREFVKCKFISCNFSQSDLRGNSFEDCLFEKCNLSMTNIEGCGLRNAHFVACKLMGLDFSRCNSFQFSFKFDDCIMDYCTFYGTKLKKTLFKSCLLKEADFTEADISGADFSGCDFSGAKFHNSNMEKADFRTAVNFSIDPENNKIKKAKFSVHSLAGLLYKYQLDIDNN